MIPLKLILLVAFFICEALAASGVGGRVNLIAAGLACYALTLFI